jgi:alanyl-tRNA synthetase
LRAQDIEEVGDNRHTTFFEMLGNWSLGDYFKVEQLPWFYEFLTDTVNLDPTKLYVTCFIGDDANNIPRDVESAEIWKKLFQDKGVSFGAAEIGSEEDGYKRGIKDGERIFFYDASKNWWCRAGKIGDMPAGEPGGPDSEVFYDFGDPNTHQLWVDEKVARAENGQSEKAIRANYQHCHVNCDCGRYMEIGNSVFMEYIKTDKGFEKLPKQNVDFGGGLERIAAAQINSPDMFRISLIWPIIDKLQSMSGKTYESHTESMRVIADHLRAATFLAVDGITPSNKEQGYVMRRLLRRAIRFAFDLGIEQNFMQEVVPVIAGLYEEDYPEAKSQREQIIAILVKEERVFRQTLVRGLRELEKRVPALNDESDDARHEELIGEVAFLLHDTYGFPIDLTEEEFQIRGVSLAAGPGNWRHHYLELMQEQRARSQTAAKGTFKGGLGGQTEIHKRYHTVAHLMGQALREVLGESTAQRGANITEERLRFDFTYPEKVPADKLKQIEDIVNQKIADDLPVVCNEYPLKEAQSMGAYGEFGDKYGDTVKVYSVGKEGEKPFSLEICGGPHVTHTGEIGEGGKKFKIAKEESSSAGVRRIKAVLQ